jgi:hypothetical protein
MPNIAASVHELGFLLVIAGLILIFPAIPVGIRTLSTPIFCLIDKNRFSLKKLGKCVRKC